VATQRVTAEVPQERPTQSSRHGRQGSLFRKYVLVFAALIGIALLASALVESYLSYQRIRTEVGTAQRREAGVVADKIGQFVGEVEDQIAWALVPVWATGP